MATAKTTMTMAIAMTDGRDEALDAIAASIGMRLTAARLVHQEASRGGFVTGHEVELADDEGTVRRETLYIDSGDHPDAPVLRLEGDDGETLSAWLYPNDPELPALAAAVLPDAASVLLRRLGFDATGLTLAVLAYRPCKRAVVRMTTASGTLYLKVLRPAAARPLHARHVAWLEAGIPVPRPLAWAPDGLVALAPLPGVAAIDSLDGLGDEFVDAIEGLVSRIAAVPSVEPARASLASRVDWYERRVRTLAPDLAQRVHDIASRISEALRAVGPVAAPTTVHGDLHLGQIFVDPADRTSIVGLLDIDTAGLGDPADDAAAMWAHLVVTAHQRGESGDTALHLATRLRERWPRPSDPSFAARAGAIAAVHLLGHALAGAFSASQALDAAEASLAG